MKSLLKKIYENVICYEEDAIQMDKTINKEIEELLQKCCSQFKDDEIEQLKSNIYQLTLTTEQEGFELGMKYAYRLFVTLEKAK